MLQPYCLIHEANLDRRSGRRVFAGDDWPGVPRSSAGSLMQAGELEIAQAQAVVLSGGPRPTSCVSFKLTALLRYDSCPM